MAFLTDRKRAVGLGSAKSGTHHFWSMKVSSVALLILIPLFVFMGIGFASLCGVFFALNAWARKKADELRLSAYERFETRSFELVWLTCASTGLVSIVLALWLLLAAHGGVHEEQVEELVRQLEAMGLAAADEGYSLRQLALTGLRLRPSTEGSSQEFHPKQ